MIQLHLLSRSKGFAKKIVGLFAPENLDKFGDHPPPPKLDPVFDGLGGLSGPVLKTRANLLG